MASGTAGFFVRVGVGAGLADTAAGDEAMDAAGDAVAARSRLGDDHGSALEQAATTKVTTNSASPA